MVILNLIYLLYLKVLYTYVPIYYYVFVCIALPLIHIIIIIKQLTWIQWLKKKRKTNGILTYLIPTLWFTPFLSVPVVTIRTSSNARTPGTIKIYISRYTMITTSCLITCLNTKDDITFNSIFIHRKATNYLKRSISFLKMNYVSFLHGKASCF